MGNNWNPAMLLYLLLLLLYHNQSFSSLATSSTCNFSFSSFRGCSIWSTIFLFSSVPVISSLIFSNYSFFSLRKTSISFSYSSKFNVCLLFLFLSSANLPITSLRTCLLFIYLANWVAIDRFYFSRISHLSFSLLASSPVGASSSTSSSNYSLT